MSSLGGRLIARPRGLVGTLSGQLGLLVAVGVLPVLAGLLVLAVLMVLSGDAVVLVAAITVAACALALAGSRLLTRAIATDLEAIRAGLDGVGSGSTTIPIVTSAGDEIARLAEATNAMIGRLESERAARDASEGARRHLLAAVSHDLRTPLTSLRLIADAVDDGIVAGVDRRRYLDQMRTQIDALDRLIDDLFELSRLEAGDMSWAMEHVGLGELLEETVETMRVQAETRGVSVQTRLDGIVSGGADLARANPERVQRVLFNLLQNAIQHTPAHGSVVVRAEPGEREVAIEVQDTGAGIPDAEREAVFLAFHRGRDGSPDGARAGDGAGLGLAVARAIVEAHGGRIWVADSARGTRVRFTLPRAFSDL